MLIVTMLISILPVGRVVSAEAATSDSDVTITVLDENGNRINTSSADTTLSVNVTHIYGNNWLNYSQDVEVTDYGNGVFGYDSSKYNVSNYQVKTKYYTVNVMLTVGEEIYTTSAQVTKDATSVVLTLDNFIGGDRWEVFDVYYIASHRFPAVFYGAGDVADYGPAGNDTPLVSINVNITKLMSPEYYSVVLHQHDVDNVYHFIPAKLSEKENEEGYQENLEYATAFWNAVKECMDEESIKAFKATGLYDVFIGYCLKNQGNAQIADNHCDGVLSVKPPVYVVEMYDYDGNIFHGYTDGNESINDDPTTMQDVLDAYNNYLNQQIKWTDNNNGVWSGSYITEQNGEKYRYDLNIVQTNASDATKDIPKSDITYQKKTDTYYLAAFQVYKGIPERVNVTVTYTDGLDEDKAFNNQVTWHDKGNKVVAFEGNTDRENYIFLGWTLDGGDGTVMTQQEILDKYTYLTEDLTFVAVYAVAPSKYTGKIEVILNGSYDSNNAVATGQRVDIIDIMGDNVSIYLSADGSEFIHLERASEGVYTAQLLNGIYHIYYYNGTEYFLSSNQELTINNDNRTRYIFFNSVSYDLNGGVDGPELLLRYFYSGKAVTVAAEQPTKNGYIFAGWKDQNGTVYNSGDLLTSNIDKAYTLTAEWVDAADVYINVTINHGEYNDEGYDKSKNKGDITLDLVYAPDVNTPYLETGDSITITSTNYPKHNYTYDSVNGSIILKTEYTANGATISNVSKDNIYSVAVEKANYNVTSVNTTVDPKNGDVTIDVVLDYAPQNQNLRFEVKVADSVPDNLVPQAAIVKIIHWSTERNCWEIIPQLENKADVLTPGVRVHFDTDNRTGTGYYPVWVYESIGENSVQAYGYRIIVTALVYPDGNIVSVNLPPLDALTQNNTDLYTVDFSEVSDDKAFGGLSGAYFENETQIGTLGAVITTEGYNVIFDAQGGTVNGYDEQIVANQYKIPSFDNFVPTRDGGYVFDGWYKDSACTVTAVEGEYLKSDIELYAKWKEPLEIEGMITVGATFEQVNEDLSVTIQEIPEHEWATSVVVLLQKIEANGYTDTVAQQVIELDYKKEDYYHEGRIVGFANYSFGQIPDYGTNYRIQVLIPNYHPTFQNEDESLDNYLKYPFYNHTDYVADFGKVDPTVATVNVHAHFSPEVFELKYSVNAEQIGSSYRPKETEILVTSDGRNTGVVPYAWNVISQMEFDDEFIGDLLETKNGKGEGSCPVWIRRADGITNYQYGTRVEDIVLYNGSRVKFSDSLPFTVEYKAPAYYLDGVQSSELTATLVPKTYGIEYVITGGTINGDYPTEHTWSYDTSISGVVATRDGYRFDGWYLDEELTTPASDCIDASVASDVTLYAKWIQIMDTVELVITVKHNEINPDGTQGGLASNYNKTLYTQLTYADRNLPDDEQVFIDMEGFAKQYPNGLWHTHGDKVKEDIFIVPKYYSNLSSEYDYGVNVMLEGYYVSEKTVEKQEHTDGSITHVVNVTLQFDPDIFNVEFYVRMAADVPQEAYPQSAEVKVTTWFDDPAADIDWDWFRITQHVKTTVTVNIDSKTGYGEGSYPVWQWFDKENSIPYHYRIEVIQLNFGDGTAIPMSETLADVSYSGGGYNAEIKVDGGSVPKINNEEQVNTKLYGVYGTEGTDISYVQEGTVGAVIDINKVIFHANNTDALCFDAENGTDSFRTYYPSGSVAEDSGLYSLNEDGKVSAFYEIPQFDYDTHNKYIFKGWYLDKDSTENPVDWNNVYNETTHIYAHWIETGTVLKDSADNKQTAGDKYIGFDLIGVQIRDKEASDKNHYGTAGSGLRFITALSEDVYAQINAIDGNGSGAEYGFVIARASAADRNAAGNKDYTLQLKGENINGVNTTSSYSYVQNLKCSGVDDHYNGETYRLYTAVITYKNLTGEQLEEQYNQNFAARSYIRYYDANGIERVHYNNYTGTHFYGGCSTSFATVRSAITN